MAGMVRVGAETWTASYGLFVWVVGSLADRVTDPAAAAPLREITDHTLGYLDLAYLEEAARSEVRALLRDLPAVAERELPASPARADVVAHVRALADLVAAHEPSTSGVDPGELGLADVDRGRDRL